MRIITISIIMMVMRIIIILFHFPYYSSHLILPFILLSFLPSSLTTPPPTISPLSHPSLPSSSLLSSPLSPLLSQPPPSVHSFSSSSLPPPPHRCTRPQETSCSALGSAHSLVAGRAPALPSSTILWTTPRRLNPSTVLLGYVCVCKENVCVCVCVCICEGNECL